MDQETFNKQYLGVFEPDERGVALCNRVVRYYNDTENMDGRDYFKTRKSFKKWCKDRFYTTEDVARAKRDAEIIIKTQDR